MNDYAKIAVDMRDAVKRYGDFTALQKTSLNIRDDGFFTLFGPSGCGKTTLLRMIAGFEDVTEGGIHLYAKRSKPCRRINVCQLHGAGAPANSQYLNYRHGLQTKDVQRFGFQKCIAKYR